MQAVCGYILLKYHEAEINYFLSWTSLFSVWYVQAACFFLGQGSRHHRSFHWHVEIEDERGAWPWPFEWKQREVSSTSRAQDHCFSPGLSACAIVVRASRSVGVPDPCMLLQISISLYLTCNQHSGELHQRNHSIGKRAPQGPALQTCTLIWEERHSLHFLFQPCF